MQSLLDMLPEDALQLRLLETGGFDSFPDGWTHCKTVPYSIIARVQQGAYEIACDGRRERVETGEAFLTGANRSLAIVHRGDAQRGGLMMSHWVHFHFTILDTIDFTSLLDMPLRLAARHAEPLGAIIEELRGQATQADDRAVLQAMVRRKELAFRALRIVCEASRMRGHVRDLLQETGRLGPVLRHIREHIGEAMNVGLLARLAHLSVPRFHAYFRQHLGAPPMDYVKGLRLGLAGQMLAATDRPVYDIASAVGFANPYHFSREFKAAFGETPTQYRKTRGLMQY